MAGFLSRLLGKRPGGGQAKERQALAAFKIRYHAYRAVLSGGAEAAGLMADLYGRLGTGHLAQAQASDLVEDLEQASFELVDGLNFLTGGGHQELFERQRALAQQARRTVEALASDEPVLPGAVFLKDLTPELLPLAGAKAASLAVLRQAGLPVPDGFAITQTACREFLRACGVLAELRRWLIGRLGSEADDWQALEEMARKAGSAITQAPLPQELARQMAAAQAVLAEKGARALAVRSSAGSEDQLEHSFAGQYATELNVVDWQGLERAFKEVLAAAFSARALAYKIQAGLAVADPDMAVFCQEMVPARTAGVLFTVDPAKPDSGRMVLSAVPGLGTLAVGGEAPADLYRVARADFSDIEAHIADKTDREVCAPGGGLVREGLPQAERGLALLDGQALAGLAELGLAVENLAGQPQDVEWAITDQGSAMVLQSRPLRLGVRARARPAEARETLHPAPQAPPAHEPPALAALRQAVLPGSLPGGQDRIMSVKDCRCLGDIARYVQEEAFQAMFPAQEDLLDQARGLMRSLGKSPGPDFLLVDLGGAFNRDGQGPVIGLDDVLCPGFQALCRGLAGQIKAAQSQGSALVLVSSDYLSVRARSSHQTARVESVCSFNPQENFLRFQLDIQGGAAPEEWGLGAFLTEVLRAGDFDTWQGSGSFGAYLGRMDQPGAEQRLAMLGRLMAFLGENALGLDLGPAPGRLAKAFLDADSRA